MRVALITVCIALFGADAAQAGCGYVHRQPAGGRPGVAPLAIGDSVMLGAAWKLSRHGFEVDAECGRSPRGGQFLIDRRQRRHTLPEIVVYALGTNIYMTSRAIRRVLRVLGPRRTLMLVTPLRSGRPFGTGPMRRAARRYPRRVKLLDWSSLSVGHREWFVADHTHLNDAGERAYTRLLHRGAWSRERGRFGRKARKR